MDIYICIYINAFGHVCIYLHIHAHTPLCLHSYMKITHLRGHKVFVCKKLQKSEYWTSSQEFAT